MSLPESDWRLLRSLHKTAVDRYCERVLEECSKTIQAEGGAHERYLRLYRLLQERDRSLGAAFDNPRRSAAIEQLASMIVLEVISAEELSRFSASTRDSAKMMADFMGRSRPRKD